MHKVEALCEPILLLQEAEGIGKTIPMVLCGNKFDWEDHMYETSTKTGINVDEVVVDLVRQLIKAEIDSAIWYYSDEGKF
ncbi:uncharacterized protein MELLADRAFT_87137 [Melampsora larici-populina 98AG31]|uniref:Uncharacterized protein n=1 Tax=Melampsora larici-populina (strain 98AG31 / pathotype 3-4-7) TaxID=747676 RepID=F4R4N0_MELLP|nr:uncharacterized protein MELLADRAFT_87137 [Melampsora larici-populina 98AG31]EGG12836.1 hypothetical protein MELLADRAFT_87137 [Melampsora larici-populina 98AG31]